MRAFWRRSGRLRAVTLGVAVFAGILGILVLTLHIFANLRGEGGMAQALRDGRFRADILASLVVTALVLALAGLIRRERKRAGFGHALAQHVIDTTPDGLIIADDDGVILRSNVGLLPICGISPVTAPGTNLSGYPIFGEDGQVVPWPSSGEILARTAPREPFKMLEIVVKEIPGEVRLRLLHVRDVTRERQDVDKIRRHEKEIAVLAALARGLNRVVDEPGLLEIAVREIQRQIPIASSGGIFKVDREGGVLRLEATFGLDDSFRAAEVVVPIGECLCGRVALTGEVIFSPSCRVDPLHTRQPEGTPHGHIVIPLKDHAETVGVLFLYLEENIEMPTTYRDLLQGVAGELGLALMRVREHEALKAETVERRRAQDNLSESEERYRKLVELSPDGIIIHAGGHILFANEMAAKVLGVREGWVMQGRSIEEIVHDESRVAASRRIAEMEATNAAAPTILHRLLRSDGSSLTAEVASVPIFLNGRKVIFSVMRDVTERLKVEEHLRNAQKMEAVGTLAAGLAHNLNNIFASLSARLSLLKDAVEQGDREAGRGNLRAASEGAEEVSGMIEQLLDFARQGTPRREEIDLGRLISRQIDLVRPLLGPRVGLQSRVEPGVRVHGDRSVLSHAVMNLVMNALHAMPEGGALTVTMEPEGAAEAVITVADTGIGMDKATLDRAFEPFFTTKPQGTGLGLSTLQAGITSLDGRVEVESAPGRGTAFRIVLPRCASSIEDTATSKPEAGRVVLLAEDDPLLRRFMLRELDLRGWHGVGVASLLELKEALDTAPPAIVLLDWHLGDETTGEAVIDLGRRGLRCAILSGDPDSVGAVGVSVLGKPVNWNELEAILNG